MENVIGAFCAPLQEIHGFFRWEDDQFNFAPLCFASNLIHETLWSLRQFWSNRETGLFTPV